MKASPKDPAHPSCPREGRGAFRLLLHAGDLPYSTCPRDMRWWAGHCWVIPGGIPKGAPNTRCNPQGQDPGGLPRDPPAPHQEPGSTQDARVHPKMETKQRMEKEGLTPSMPLAHLNIFLIFSCSLLPAYFMLWLSSVGDQGLNTEQFGAPERCETFSGDDSDRPNKNYYSFENLCKGRVI